MLRLSKCLLPLKMKYVNSDINSSSEFPLLLKLPKLTFRLNIEKHTPSVIRYYNCGNTTCSADPAQYQQESMGQLQACASRNISYPAIPLQNPAYPALGTPSQYPPGLYPPNQQQ